jgi:hypothetical protein
MIEKFVVVGAASLVMAAAGAVNYQNGGVIARTGAGTYTFTCDTPLAASSAVVTVTPIVAQGVAISATVVQTSQTVWTITTAATLGGGAADIAGSIAIKVSAIPQAGLGI